MPCGFCGCFDFAPRLGKGEWGVQAGRLHGWGSCIRGPLGLDGLFHFHNRPLHELGPSQDRGCYFNRVANWLRAWCTVALRTAARSPAKCCTSLCTPAGVAQPNHTVPTGLSALPPVGPATPVTATATWARECCRAPCTMARTTGSLTAPWVAISVASTPSISVLAVLE